MTDADVKKTTIENDAENIPEDAQNDSPVSTEPVTLTSEEFKALKTKADEAGVNYDKLLRAHAEMDNLRKRMQKEKLDGIAFANEGLMEAFLPVVDNLELAAASLDQTDNVKAIKDGIKMVFAQLKQVLKDNGLEEVNAVGKPFDYNMHEAISEVESEEHPEGTVVQQTRKGYKLKTRLIRPANVTVAKKKGSTK